MLCNNARLGQRLKNVASNFSTETTQTKLVDRQYTTAFIPKASKVRSDVNHFACFLDLPL